VKFAEDLETSLNARTEFTEVYQQIISKYLQCNTKSQIISIVYIYVDWGIKNALLEEWAGKKPKPVTNQRIFNLLHQEQILIQLLEGAEKKARREGDFSGQHA